MFELLGLTMIIPCSPAPRSEVHGGKSAITHAIRAGMESVGCRSIPMVILIVVVLGFTLKAVVTITTMRYVSDIVAGISNSFQVQAAAQPAARPVELFHPPAAGPARSRHRLGGSGSR